MDTAQPRMGNLPLDILRTILGIVYKSCERNCKDLRELRCVSKRWDEEIFKMIYKRHYNRESYFRQFLKYNEFKASLVLDLPWKCDDNRTVHTLIVAGSSVDLIRKFLVKKFSGINNVNPLAPFVQRKRLDLLRKFISMPEMKYHRADSTLIALAFRDVDTQMVLLEDKSIVFRSSVELGDVLLTACYNGDIESMRIIMDDGRFTFNMLGGIREALSQCKIAGERFPLSHCKKGICKHVELIEYLYRKYGRKWEPKYIIDIFYTSIQNGYTNLVKILLEDPHINPTAHNNLALTDAIRLSHKEIIRMLLDDPRIKEWLYT